MATGGMAINEPKKRIEITEIKNGFLVEVRKTQLDYYAFKSLSEALEFIGTELGGK